MKQILILSLVLFTGWSVMAQSSKVNPGQTYTNNTSDTVYVIPSQKVKSLLKSAVANEINEQKLGLYQQKISLFEERTALADSAITIKKLEANYWHDQLLQNDLKLENQQIENLKLVDEKNRIRQSRVYYLVAGLVAGAVIVSL
ncbi:hypothetical protein [Sunxiuqinia elliptica]|uniref:Uncharacterized protein n=1 Tax=Sunxiuqinia elliptica TaxID=655355 RepID=A0A4R6GYU7_9BACT|nr:hypothetical protein [Sunxiuqinia elliptica]TDO00046.1 hypothetical protein DET52_106259 [Sunxiuqinia elliptica]TDO57237.1 hypothetical protein DET65_3823 [Sunxiuqinia elliptica]